MVVTQTNYGTRLCKPDTGFLLLARAKTRVTAFAAAADVFPASPAAFPAVAICQHFHFETQFSQAFPVSTAGWKKPYQRGEARDPISRRPYQCGGRELPQ
jgi:hypothetical protein